MISQKLFCEIKPLFNPKSHQLELDNEFTKEIILFLWKNDKYFSDLSAVWLQFRQNPMQNYFLHLILFLLDFTQIVSCNQIDDR